MANTRTRPERAPEAPPGAFARAVVSAFRAIAGPAAADPAGACGRLTELAQHCVTADDIARLRGQADAQALRLRYHDARLHARTMPVGEEARAVYDAIEQARVEALGGRRMAGVSANLSALIEQHCRARKFDRATSRAQVPLAEALYVLARERFGGTPPPPAARAMAELWRPFVEARAGRALEVLGGRLHDEEAFAAGLNALVGALELEGGSGEPEDERKLGHGQDETHTEEAPEQRHGAGEAAPHADSPQRRVSAGRAAGLPGAAADALASPERGVGDPGAAASRRQVPSLPGGQAYHPYTTAFDQTVDAEDLCEAGELHRLRRQLDRELVHFQHLVGRLANRLQRRLLARQMRDWAFDLEEGLLDTGRLDRIVVSPDHGLSFKLEKDSDFRDTAVSLLIDNSASMRGRPITVAAMSADLLARTLERCGIKVEILGFTTRAWKGGQAREQWRRDGEPAAPGRLNDLRHILYKAADTPWRRARKNLGLMLREGLPKENIDGEALLWAHRRLIARPERRRILVVISDGEPADDSTLSANPGHYLAQHLRDVIAWIEQRSPVELVAIGIGHDVSRYYCRAVTIDDADALAGVMLEQLSALFEEEVRRPRPSAPARGRTAR